MKQRGITELQVENAFRDPHSRAPADRPGAMRITHKLNTVEAIVVIAEETPKFIRIVSTWIEHA
jgi:hypothetical protein